MNYLKIYNSIVYKRQVTEPLTHSKECYTELHHYLPKCLFPQFKNLKQNPWNGVRLTAREHFIIHVLLHKIYPSEYKLICAVNMMSNYRKNNSKIYEWIKIKFSKMMAEKGVSEETKTKMSLAKKGIPYSEETKIKHNKTRELKKAAGIEKKDKGISRTEEYKKKSAETRAKNKAIAETEGIPKKPHGNKKPKSAETITRAAETKARNKANGKVYNTPPQSTKGVSKTKEGLAKRAATRAKNLEEGKVYNIPQQCTKGYGVGKKLSKETIEKREETKRRNKELKEQE